MEESYSMMQGKKGMKVILALVAILAITSIAIISILRDRIVNPPQFQISVTGEARVAYQPDIANVTLGVQIDKALKADEALNQLNDKVAKIIAAEKALGIAAEDIQTQNYSLYSQYDYINNASTLSGYNANQQLTIKVRDIVTDPNKVSKVIAEASKAGANQVSGVSFDVSNIKELKQQARIQAINDAKSKSSAMAGALGVSLKRVVGWWENVIQAPGAQSSYDIGGKGGMGGGASSGSPVVPSGTQEIIMEINLSYQIK